MCASPHPVDLKLGQAVRRRRQLLGLTQSALAEACGIRFQQVQKYECAANAMSARRLWQIARALGARVDDFFSSIDMESAR